MSSAVPELPTSMLLGYTRGASNLQAQIQALTERGVESDRIYRESAGAADSPSPEVGRPAMVALLDYARPGDTVVVAGIDRLGRSSAEALQTIREFNERGLHLWTAREQVDSRTKTGSMIIGVLASLAMLDAEASQQAGSRRRTRRHSARSAMGRPRALSREQIRLAQQLRDAGQPVPLIAESLGVSRATLYRSLAEKQVTQ